MKRRERIALCVVLFAVMIASLYFNAWMESWIDKEHWATLTTRIIGVVVSGTLVVGAFAATAWTITEELP